jgi:hypothetical protein
MKQRSLVLTIASVLAASASGGTALQQLKNGTPSAVQTPRAAPAAETSAFPASFRQPPGVPGCCCGSLKRPFRLRRALPLLQETL